MFFHNHPVESMPSASTPAATPHSDDYEHSVETLAAVDALVAAADAGDAAARARAQGLAAQIIQGDSRATLGYFEEAGRLGDVDSMFDAGCLNRDLENRGAAVYWWETAAELGDARSTQNLGALAAAEGDLPRARHWFERTATLGDPQGYAARCNWRIRLAIETLSSTGPDVERRRVIHTAWRGTASS